MPTDFIIKALGFGVLGLCAVMLVVIWRIVLDEQRRKAEPRAGILRVSYVFMSFCVVLALLNAWVQLHSPDEKLKTQHRAELAKLETQRQEERTKLVAKLQEERAKLERVRSAATPLLNVRGDVISQLPDNLPQKATLGRLLAELRDIVR
jgi:hypothetical protein